MASTVSMGSFNVSSNSESAEDMVKALTPTKEDEPGPKVISDQGEAVTPEDEEKAKLAKAGSELGRKGAQATAEKRAKAEKVKAAEPEPEEEPEPEAAAEEKPEDKKEAKSRAQQRVEAATREAAEAKRERDRERQERERLAQRLNELERRVTSPQGESKPSASASSEDPEPKAAAYEDYEKFVADRARWETRRAVREEFEKHRSEALNRHMAATYEQEVGGAIKSFNERLAAAAKADPEIYDRIQPLATQLQPSFLMEPGQRPGPLNVIADEILGSESAPHLMLLFQEHPEEFQRIAALRTPREITREMAILETRLSDAIAGASSEDEEPESKPAVSKASPPVRPAIGTPSIATDQGYREGMSLDEYARNWKPKR